MSNSVARLIRDTDDIQPAVNWFFDMVNRGIVGGPVHVEIGREKRSLSQNKKMWPMLTDIAKQVKHFDLTLTPEEWKDLITAAIRGQKMVPGIDGGMVMLGRSTSKMNKKEFSELIEYMYWFGQDNDVQWSEKALEIYQEYREANNG